MLGGAGVYGRLSYVTSGRSCFLSDEEEVEGWDALDFSGTDLLVWVAVEDEDEWKEGC
jgi:hypothetical protein